MQAERDYLVRFVFPRVREALLDHQIRLIDVDLRWGVTSEQDALEVCREIIDECHPRFLCILGGRYGWVPQGADRSITADEVQYGVLERREHRDGAFFYFRNPATTATMVEESPGEFREPEGSAAESKLAALKADIERAGLQPFTYNARWDAAYRRLIGLEQFGDRVFGDLLQSLSSDPNLADHFCESGNLEVDEFTEQAAETEAFIQERVERFIAGRRQSIIDAVINFAASDRQPNVLVLTGDSGSGKSALLTKIHQSLRALTNKRVVSHFVGASKGSTDLRHTLRRLCHALAPADTVSQNLDELINRFRSLLTNSSQPIVVIIDALNQLDPTDDAHGLHWIPTDLPPHVRIVTSTLEHPILEILRRRGASMETLEPLSQADASAIIDAFLRRYGKRFDATQVAELLAKSAADVPLYLLTALEELRTLGTYEEITTRIRELPGETRALFMWILKERLPCDPGFRDQAGQACGFDLVEKFSACLRASRHGLSALELTEILAPAESPDARDDPLGNVAALLRLLQPYLMQRGEFVDFFHAELREAAADLYLADAGKRRKAHRTLVQYFARAANPLADGMYTGGSVHALSELSFHQVESGADQEASITLQSVFFLEAKVVAGMAFDLPDDFARAIASFDGGDPRFATLRVLAKALRRDLNFIARHADDYPQAVFQCLWNSCWSYSEPESSRLEAGAKAKVTHTSADPDSSSTFAALLSRWLQAKQLSSPGFFWIRSLRAPSLSPACLAVFTGHQEIVNAAVYSADGSRIFSVASDFTLRVWDAETNKELQVIRSHDSAVTTVACSPEGSIVVAGSDDGCLRLWNVQNKTTTAVVHLDEPITCLSFSPDGQVLAAATRLKRVVHIWKVSDWREMATLPTHGPVTQVDFSAKGDRLATASGLTIQVFDTQTSKQTAVMVKPSFRVTSLAFSPDGRSIVSGSKDGTVAIWDVETGKEMCPLIQGKGSIGALVAYSRDGRSIAVARGSTVELWDAGRRIKFQTLEGHSNWIRSVAFSPDSARIVTSSTDQQIRTWRIGHREKSYPCESGGGRGGSVGGGSFSLDGRYLATTSGLEVSVFSVDEGRHVVIRSGPSAWSVPQRCIFSADSTRLLVEWDVTGEYDGTHYSAITGWNTSDWSPSNVTEDFQRAAEFAAGKLGPIRMVALDDETVVQSEENRKIVAYYPHPLRPQICHPTREMGAGNFHGDLHVIALEPLFGIG